MPYEWRAPSANETRLHLWPHRSLSLRGFVWFIAATGVLIATPLIAVLGTPVLWGLLPFIVLAVAAIWLALRRSFRDGQLSEVLVLTPALITLTRHDPKRRRDWQANPYWVRVTLHETGGPVPNYLTLRGDDREVEIGAFLSEDERIALDGDLRHKLAALRQGHPPAKDVDTQDKPAPP